MGSVVASFELFSRERRQSELLTEGLQDKRLAHLVGMGASKNHCIQQILEILIQL